MTKRKTWLLLMWVCLGGAGLASGQGEKPTPDRFAALQFLQGTWEAKATRADGVAVTGRYAFTPELNGTVLARHSTEDPGCKGPAIFDCAHNDLLYVFADVPGGGLRAIYFDSEGHVLHYGVHVSSPTAVEFLSDPGPGPQFRLVYELAAGVMTGRFEMRAPGSAEWNSYLQWSGRRTGGSQ